MTITDKSWTTYIDNLRKVNDTAAALMANYLAKVRKTDPTLSLISSKQMLINYAFGLATKYGEAAAELACEAYDQMGILSQVVIPAAEPAATATIHEVAKAVNGTLKYGNDQIVAGAIGRLVKLASVDTMVNNALRDGAQFAWVPKGDTCPYCIMLASNGWVTASKRAIRDGHAEHVHSNCDCTYAVRFNDSVDVEGYDPDDYYDRLMHGKGIDADILADVGEYEEGDNLDWKEGLEALRRQHYRDHKDEINANRRAAYALKKQQK